MSRVECMCWCIHTGDVYACSSAELCVAAWVPCSNITTYNLCAFISKNRKMHTKINTTKCAHTHIHLAMYTCAQTSMWDPLRIPFRTKKKMGILHLYILILLLYLLHRETRGRILFLHILCVYDQRNAYWHMYTSHLNFHASFFIFISLFFFILWLSV